MKTAIRIETKNHDIVILLTGSVIEDEIALSIKDFITNQAIFLEDKKLSIIMDNLLTNDYLVPIYEISLFENKTGIGMFFGDN